MSVSMTSPRRSRGALVPLSACLFVICTVISYLESIARRSKPNLGQDLLDRGRALAVAKDARDGHDDL